MYNKDQLYQNKSIIKRVTLLIITLKILIQILIKIIITDQIKYI